MPKPDLLSLTNRLILQWSAPALRKFLFRYHEPGYAKPSPLIRRPRSDFLLPNKKVKYWPDRCPKHQPSCRLTPAEAIRPKNRMKVLRHGQRLFYDFQSDPDQLKTPRMPGRPDKKHPHSPLRDR